ncbi:unnamed protein product, partial [Rotaria sp. Silwood2]
DQIFADNGATISIIREQTLQRMQRNEIASYSVKEVHI